MVDLCFCIKQDMGDVFVLDHPSCVYHVAWFGMWLCETSESTVDVKRQNKTSNCLENMSRFSFSSPFHY